MRLLNSLLLVLLTFPLSRTAFGQVSLFEPSSTTAGQLTAEQKLRFEKVLGHGLYLSTSFVTMNSIEQASQDGYVMVSLPTLPCEKTYFFATRANYSNELNYQWSGRSFRNSDSVCSVASMDVAAINGGVMGHLSYDDRSFELYDLSGGLFVLCETNLALFGENDCGTTKVSTATATTNHEPCANHVTRVLVLFNAAANAAIPDVQAVANTGLAQVNNIWANSGIANTAQLAAVVPFTFSQNPTDFQGDADALAANSAAQNLRTTHNADIVVLLGTSYTLTNGSVIRGIAQQVGGVAANAYAIVDATTATNGRYDFAHEVNHIYAARHNDDNADLPARGRIFKAPSSLFSPRRYTLMSNLPSGKSRIEHLSNPNVNYQGKSTGESQRDNALRVNSFRQQVAAFSPDGVIPIDAALTVTDPVDCGNRVATATVATTCGTPPYTYAWRLSSNGINWGPVVSTSQTVSFTLPLPYPLQTASWSSKHVRCTVTDAVNATVTRTDVAHYFCPPNPGGGYRLAGKPADDVLTTSTANVAFFPNPVGDGALSMSLSLSLPGNVQVKLYDVLGREVARLFDGELDKGEHKITLPASGNLSSGVYTLVMSGAGREVRERLVIR